MIHWNIVKEFEDITYKKCNGIARIAFNRPEVRNAFRPKTVFELYEALEDAKEDNDIGVVLISGEGPSKKMVAGHFVQEAIKMYAQKLAIKQKTVFLALIY